jgi:hypothetical protein
LKKTLHGEPDRRVRIATASPVVFEKLRGVDVFEAVAARGTCDAGKGVKCAGVSADWFRAIQIHPALGRVFLANEERSANVAILSARFWKKMYGGDSGIIGQRVDLGGEKYTVVGIVRADVAEADVYLPWSPSGDSIMIVALLRPGVTLKQAQAAADAAGAKSSLEPI